jgi:hypothetical protein
VPHSSRVFREGRTATGHSAFPALEELTRQATKSQAKSSIELLEDRLKSPWEIISLLAFLLGSPLYFPRPVGPPSPSHASLPAQSNPSSNQKGLPPAAD